MGCCLSQTDPTWTCTDYCSSRTDPVWVHITGPIILQVQNMQQLPQTSSSTLGSFPLAAPPFPKPALVGTLLRMHSPSHHIHFSPPWFLHWLHVDIFSVLYPRSCRKKACSIMDLFLSNRGTSALMLRAPLPATSSLTLALAELFFSTFSHSSPPASFFE